MRTLTRRLTFVGVVALLLAAAPATRPSAPPDRLTLRVERAAGTSSAASTELTLEPGAFFSSRTRVGPTTLSVSGDLTAYRGTYLLHVAYEEQTVDARTGGRTCNRVQTTLAAELNKPVHLGGDPGGDHIMATLYPADEP